MARNPQRIDLHSHIIVPKLAAALSASGIEWTGGTGVPPSDTSVLLENMARQGIATAVASTQPHIHWDGFGDVEQWTRHCNEYLARFVQDDPEHFGGFAQLPLPDPEAACREMEYALDVLKLDGIHMLTSAAGQYPGDPALEELFQELNKRSAVVGLHPTTIPPFSNRLNMSVPTGLVEMLFDSTRCVANLLYSGTLHRYPAIKFIVPHTGGTIPFVAGRVALGAQFVPSLRAQVPLGPMHYLQKLYYDIAISTSDLNLAALRRFVPASQIVYGSDLPYVHGPLLEKMNKAFDESPLFTEAEKMAIDRDNALQLFPRFARALVS